MSEWDTDDLSFTDHKTPSENSRKKKNAYVGKLNLGMMLACFLSVTFISFLVAWLMKDRVRNFWEMGLTFAAPFAALMISSMLVEKNTDRMTPVSSRNAQLVCVLVTIITAFIIGCLAETLHQPVIIEREEPEYDYLIVLDKSASMVGSELEESSQKALHELIDNMNDINSVGIAAFGTSVIGKQEILPLDAEQRAKIGDIIDIPIKTWEEKDEKTGESYTVGDGTDFSKASKVIMDLIEIITERARPVRIILVTDGDDQSKGNFSAFNKWASEMNQQDLKEKKVELCAIQLGTVPMLDMVKDAVIKTSGTIYDQVPAAELVQQLQTLQTALIIPEPVDTLKATYEGQTADGKPNSPYMILTCVLLIIQGVLSGFALRIMFSVQGQFRFQTILSPLMGVAAFLLLNFGRFIGIAPAWICEAIAFSGFGLVFMRENRNPGKCISDSGTKKSGKKTNTPAKTSEVFDEDF